MASFFDLFNGPSWHRRWSSRPQVYCQRDRKSADCRSIGRGMFALPCLLTTSTYAQLPAKQHSRPPNGNARSYRREGRRYHQACKRLLIPLRISSNILCKVQALDMVKCMTYNQKNLSIGSTAATTRRTAILWIRMRVRMRMGVCSRLVVTASALSFALRNARTTEWACPRALEPLLKTILVEEMRAWLHSQHFICFDILE